MMNCATARSNLSVQAPPWDLLDDQTAIIASPFSVNLKANATGDSPSCLSPADAVAALRRFLPSNNPNIASDSDFLIDEYDCDISVDTFSCDHFRMFEFKVRKCTRGRSHDWTECPYAHPGEKARRRDPRKYNYSGTPCPEFRKGQCRKGDSCEYAHGVFECWLHPGRYRTQPCKDGTLCRRRVCFFAHTHEQLRVIPHNGSPTSDSCDGCPSGLGFDSFFPKGSFEMSAASNMYSPPSSESPPMSPNGAMGGNSVSELAVCMKNLQIGKPKMSMSSPAWGIQMSSGYCSPRSPSTLRPGCLSLSLSPTRPVSRSGLDAFDLWQKSRQEEPILERVESGKNLRARIYAKLSKENSLDRVDPESPVPDFGWISELVK